MSSTQFCFSPSPTSVLTFHSRSQFHNTPSTCNIDTSVKFPARYRSFSYLSSSKESIIRSSTPITCRASSAASFSMPSNNGLVTTSMKMSSSYLDSLQRQRPEADSGDSQGGGSNRSNGGDKGNGNRGGDGDPQGDDGLPKDLKEALAYGSLTKEALQRYHMAKRNPFVRLLLSFPAFRTRFLADSAFMFKLAVQEVVGNGTALASELVVRGKDVVDELEYVASDLIVGTVVEAAFVWILAPTLAVATKGNQSMIQKVIQGLPAHLFQPSTALEKFSIPQRAGSFVYSGIQYAYIGFIAGIVGTAITYGLLRARKIFDKEYESVRPLPAVIPNSAAWGAFMALSSNTRFQFVEGLELGIARIFQGRMENVVKASIIFLRLANNYWGGVQFVQFFRYLGLHAVAEDHE